ncbi:MAG: hypothetical protein L0Y56_06910 [Nitrospira sp.]|nr:hypothetical protein [Nitrospira sp.]
MDTIRSDDTAGFVAILGALRRELVYIRPEIKIQRRVNRNGVRFWIGSHGPRKIILAQTGVGPNQAQQATRVTLSSFPVKVLISVGFACALNQDMKIGDLVMGESASFLCGDPCGERGEALAKPDVGRIFLERARDYLGPYPADGRLLLLASEVLENDSLSGSQRVTVFKGPLLTVRRIIEYAVEKRTLASTTGAIALDMESAAIACVAADAQIAYLPVRAISDLVDEDVGGVSHLFSGEGTFRPFKGLLYLLSHPNDLTHLNRLRAQTTIASKQLGRFIHDYLHLLN